MNNRGHHAVAGAFENSQIAHSCDDALDREGFSHRWLALTEREEGGERASAVRPGAAASPEDDGRFVSGAGSSLRRSLEDHGIEAHEAIEIDESLIVGGAVIVVAAHDRSEVAASIIRSCGGRVYGCARATEATT